jgi:hypothetical protein
LGQHEEQAELPEPEIVLGPERRPIPGDLEQGLNVDQSFVQCYDMT